MLPKISIVTPSFNQGIFLEDTILSILNQNYPNLEYIIIDGGSTDSSKNIIRKYENHLTYWESKKDRGQAHAINKGFQKCTGDIITFCNSDDIYLDDSFQYIGGIWNEWKSFGALVGAFQYMNDTSEFLDQPRKAQMEKNGPFDLTIGNPGNYRLHQVSTFFTKHALDKVDRLVDENLHYVFDRELLYRVVKKYPIYLDERVLGAFRIHKQSKSISKIIQFSEEFAALYRSKKSGNKVEDTLREKAAINHIFKGWIKLIKNQKNRLHKIKIALTYIIKYPLILFYPSKMKKLVWATIANI